MPVQRIVCFKFKEGVSPAERARHMADFSGMKEAIPQIRSYSGGATIPNKNGETPEWDSMHYLTYADAHEMAVYVDAPAHKAFVERNRSLWEKVLVVCSEA